MEIYIQQISEEKIEILLGMLRKKADWLIRIGKPMWNPKLLSKEEFLRKYSQGKMFIIQKGRETIGGFILVEKDKLFWSAEENSQEAYYIHKLVIKDEYTGKGYSRDAIERIKKYSKINCKKYLRLDCYGDRDYLNKLYKQCGFILKQEIKVEDNLSSNLYELLLP